MRRSLLALVVLVGCGGATPPRFDDSRIAIVGASVSAGFGSGTSFSNILKSRTDKPVQDLSDPMMFRDPVKLGKEQIARAKKFDPTLLFAVDYLFWYAYGEGMTLKEREARVDQGLALLDTIEATILLGDIPDMSVADAKMLPRTAIPNPFELKALNAHIDDWAAKRERVHRMPLTEWTRPLFQNDPIVVKKGADPIPAEQLMLWDRLHPNERGLIYLIGRVGERVLAVDPNGPAYLFQK